MVPHTFSLDQPCLAPNRLANSDNSDITNQSGLGIESVYICNKVSSGWAGAGPGEGFENNPGPLRFGRQVLFLAQQTGQHT